MALINARNAGKMSQIKQPHALTAERPFPRAPGAQVKATKRLSRSKGWSLVGSCGCSACDRGADRRHRGGSVRMARAEASSFL